MITTVLAVTLLAGGPNIDIDTEKTLRSADALAKDFNEAIGKPRVVAIIAPT